MSLRKTSLFLVVLLEILGMLALLGTQEIHPTLIFVTMFFGVIKVLPFSKRLPVISNTWLLPLIIFLFLASIGVYFRWRIHPILIAGHVGPCLLIFLSLLPSQVRNLSWIVASAFLNIVIAISLSPEFYLAALLFAFVVVTSLAISSLFMLSQFETHDSKLADGPVPKGFLGSSFVISSLVFISSLIIFPILPRTQLSVGFGISRDSNARVGFSDQVQLSEVSNLLGVGQGEVVLSIFIPEKSTILNSTFWIPMGLLKSRSLDLFDGEKWLPHRRMFRSPKPQEVSHWNLEPGYYRLPANEYWINEYIREPMAQNILPVPYGLLALQIPESEPMRPVQLLGREWIAPQSSNRRVQYRVRANRDTASLDPPSSEHLEVPRNYLDPESQFLKFFKAKISRMKNTEDRIRFLHQFFLNEGFKPSGDFATLAKIDQIPKGLTPQERTKWILEKFFFDVKKGHCELFSSSLAILLRMSGVPARLVSGFKIIRESTNRVFTIRQGDAHAWVEAWTERRGWIPLDVTPATIVNQSTVLAQLRELRESISAHWFRYVVKYSPQEQRELGARMTQEAYKEVKEWFSKERWRTAEFFESMFPTMILLVVFFTGFLFIRSKRFRAWRIQFASQKRWNRYVPKDLRPRRRKMEYLLMKLEKNQTPVNQSKITEWQELDERIRFGKPQEDTPHFLLRIDQLEKEISTEFSKKRRASSR